LVSAPEELTKSAAATTIADTKTPTRSPGITVLLQFRFAGMLPQKSRKEHKNFFD
jgi:hypothetical protein